jgi:coproporphyrinogen III oxidase-like Fe-S oxidoreductase
MLMSQIVCVMTRLSVYVQVPFCQTKCTHCNFHAEQEANPN